MTLSKMAKAKKTGSERATPVFNEREHKLRASSTAQLNRVRNFVLSNAHYVPAYEAPLAHGLLDGMELLGPPESTSAMRVRVYYDDEKLHGYRNGVEIRIEPRVKEHKLVVKIGDNVADKKEGGFDREEHVGKLKSFRPDFKGLDAPARNRLKKVYGVKNVDDIKVRPMIMIVSQRWRYVYHPAGNKKASIEYAHDVARGQTFTGYEWGIFEAELELKKGNPAVLRREEARLLRAFNFLSHGTYSKPSPGFDVLQRILLADDDTARKFVKTEMKPGPFQVYKSLPFDL